MTEPMVRLTRTRELQLLINLRKMKWTKAQRTQLEIAMDLGWGAIESLLEQADQEWQKWLEYKI